MVAFTFHISRSRLKLVLRKTLWFDHFAELSRFVTIMSHKIIFLPHWFYIPIRYHNLKTRFFKKWPDKDIKSPSDIDHLQLFTITAQQMKFCMKDFFSKCDQIHRKLRIWSHAVHKLVPTSTFLIPSEMRIYQKHYCKSSAQNIVLLRYR